jgi:hypothetical protein
MSRRFALLPGILVAIGLFAPAAAQAGEGALTPSTNAVEFGPVDIHFGGSPRQSVQFSDNSASTITVESVSVAGSSSFQVVSDGCSYQTVGPGPGSCTVEVAFSPRTAGTYSAALQLTDSEGTVEVPLTGEGITGTLSSQENPLSFTAIPYTAPFREGQNETEQATIQNSADAGTQVGEVRIQGPDASSFDVQYGNCEHALLAPGNTCSVGVQFQPTSPGLKHAELIITSDSAASPLIVPLEGEGLLGPKITMSSYQELLGEVQLGDTIQRTFTLTNTGDYPLGVQQTFLVSGTPLMFPVLSDGCTGQIIRQGASCSVTVAFTPGTVGEKAASLLIITSDSLPVTVVGMTGTGVAPPVAAPPPPAPELPHRLAVPSVPSVPRTYTAPAAGALDTGVIVSCPAHVSACVIDSFIKSGVPARRTSVVSGVPRAATVLLGGTTIRLRGGSSALVRIALSARARVLLGEGARLHATVGSVVRTGGMVVASRTWGVILVRAPAARR